MSDEESKGVRLVCPLCLTASDPIPKSARWTKDDNLAAWYSNHFDKRHKPYPIVQDVLNCNWTHSET